MDFSFILDSGMVFLGRVRISFGKVFSSEWYIGFGFFWVV